MKHSNNSSNSVKPDKLDSWCEQKLDEICKKAISRKTGAIGLRSIFEDIMLDVMFNIKDYKNQKNRTKFY